MGVCEKTSEGAEDDKSANTPESRAFEAVERPGRLFLPVCCVGSQLMSGRSQLVSTVYEMP